MPATGLSRPARRTLVRSLAAGAMGGALVAGLTLVALGLPGTPPAAAYAPAPESCVRVIDGVEWTLDPCIAEGEPLPPDFADTLEDIAQCPDPVPSDLPDSPAAGRAAPQVSETATAPPGSPTAPPPTSSPTSPPTTPPTSPPTDDPPECPPVHDPVPWPGYPPPGSPEPTPSETLSPDPLPSDEDCADQTPNAIAADEPKDEKADRIKCRKPGGIPDPKKPITLVAAGNSLVSAHHQTGFGVGTCDETAADGRGLKGNDANFSFAGKYYEANPQIVEYYNFARTGFSTKDFVAAAAADTDGCETPWNRNDTPLNLSKKVIQAAKAAGRSAYFVADGGINNTNWVKLVGQLGKCYGIDFAVNNLLTGARNFGVQVDFYYVVPKVAPNDPPRGLKKNIVKKGGACYGTVTVLGRVWWTRIDVPAYNGPGSDAPSELSKRIKKDVGDAIQVLLNAGTDKIVWMLYFNINPAKVDVANLGLAWARAQMPAWLARWLPNSVWAWEVALVEGDFAGDVNTMTTNLNNEIKGGIPVNAKVKAYEPVNLLGTDEIQKTAIGGCPHPNDNGHVKLKDKLKETYDGM